MSTVDRITNLAKEKGITQAFISSKIGVHRNWLSCVRRDNVKISDERIAIIADILGTTTAYLKGETDDPETGNKKSPSELDELLQQPDITELLALYRSLPEKEQKRALSVLKALKESE
jgi:transcriptional regulator with XRE-family HTH domain